MSKPPQKLKIFYLADHLHVRIIQDVVLAGRAMTLEPGRGDNVSPTGKMIENCRLKEFHKYAGGFCSYCTAG